MFRHINNIDGESTARVAAKALVALLNKAEHCCQNGDVPSMTDTHERLVTNSNDIETMNAPMVILYRCSSSQKPAIYSVVEIIGTMKERTVTFLM